MGSMTRDGTPRHDVHRPKTPPPGFGLESLRRGVRLPPKMTAPLELEDHERLALGGIIRMIIRSDGDFSEEEEETVNQIGERHFGGPAEIWRLISASAQASQDDAAIKAAIRGVTRPEAREFVLSVAREVAAGDELTDDEQRLLDWVAAQYA